MKKQITIPATAAVVALTGAVAFTALAPVPAPAPIEAQQANGEFPEGSFIGRLMRGEPIEIGGHIFLTAEGAQANEGSKNAD